jgi:ABC-type hemin transport system ATPase subunit
VVEGADGCPYLVERFGLDSVGPWENILSLGEQQRMAFARVLCRVKGKGQHDDGNIIGFVVMDEATGGQMIRFILHDTTSVEFGHKLFSGIA